MDAADQPTIEQILEDYCVRDYLTSRAYSSLLDALNARDSVMRTDAAKYRAEKALKRALDELAKED